MELLKLYKLSRQMDLNTPEVLDEANLKQLYTKSLNETPGFADRADKLGSKSNAVRYFGLSDDGTWNFKVKSQTRPGKYHYVYIESADMLKFTYLASVMEEDFTEKDLAKLLTMNGFRVGCGCESWLYWAFQYMATVGNYEIEPENRAPKRNNTELAGALCKHLILVIKNIYENKQMRVQLAKDINSYLRMLNDLDYEEFQELKHTKQIRNQNRAVKWKNKPTDFMNNYFARKAKQHPFLDDHDIVKSLRSEVRKYVKANKQASVDDFLKDYFGMTKKAFADEMDLSEFAIDDYFTKEIGFKEPSGTPEVQSDTEVEVKEEPVKKTGNKVNIVNKGTK